MKLIKKAVIPIGGLGTRFLPITLSMAKEMLPVNKIPVLEYIIKEVYESGIEEIIFVNTLRKKYIEKYFNHFRKIKLTFIYQDEASGNGEAILAAYDYVKGEPFAVLWGDDLVKSEVPALRQLIEQYNKTPGNIIGVQEVEHTDTYKYGIIKLKDGTKNQIETIVEKPKVENAPSDYAGLGRYIVNPEIFDELRNTFKEEGEFYFTDALAKLCKYQNTYACFYEGKYLDIGNQLGYIKANIEYSLDDTKINEHLEKYLNEIIKK